MRKTLCILYYVLMALPIPLSMATWIGTVMMLANLDMAGGEGLAGAVYTFVAVLAMLLARTYLISYVCSLIRVIHVKKVTFSTFLPIIHIVVTGISLYLWAFLDKR